MPLAVGIAVVVFAVIFAATKYISAGSLAGALILPVTLIIQRYVYDVQVDLGLIILALALCLVIFYAHRGNIVRLIRGEENKFKRVEVFV